VGGDESGLTGTVPSGGSNVDGHSQLPKLITGVKFIDGIEAVSQQPLAA
jgi:hypothetical protein